MTDSYSPELSRELDRCTLVLICTVRLRFRATTKERSLPTTLSPFRARRPKKMPRRTEGKRFVGGGFAGQVYKVRVESIGPEGIPGVAVGAVYALKILIPPSAFSNGFATRFTQSDFRELSAPMQPGGAQSGALWQKFIRRAARVSLATAPVMTFTRSLPTKRSAAWGK